MAASVGALIKLTGGGIIVLAFAFWQTLGIGLRRWFPLAARRYANRVTSLGCRAFLRHWGITVTLRNSRHIEPRRTYLYALNHLSYLDILVHGALFPSTFVTSREMHGTPFLGHICRFAQCFFVDRLSGGGWPGRYGPSAASSRTAFPSRCSPRVRRATGPGPALQESAVQGGRGLGHAGAAPDLNYRTLDSVPVGPGNRGDVCWYGGMAFFPHVWRLLQHRRVEVDVVVAPPVVETDYRALAEKAREAVAGSYIPLV